MSGFTSARTITLNTGGGTFDTDGNNATLSGAIGGGGSLTVANSGSGGALALTNSGNSYTGATTINSGATLALSGAGTIASSSGLADNGRFDISGLNGGTSITSLSGSGAVALGANTLTLSNASGTFSGAIDGTGGLTLTTGTETLSGTNPYSGATTINGGSLDVTGSITGTSSVTVNSGGTLGGTGIVDPLTVTINSGATFAPGTAGVPGTSITIAGNLAFASGALYVVYLNPTTSTFANVTGSASLAGTVQANFASGNYVAKQYTILTASGGVSGTFSAISNLGLPAGARDTLSYSGNDVFLNLVPGFTTYTGLTINQQNVANALSNYFNSTGGIPSQFFALPPSGLSQLDGEAGTGAERSALQLTNEFLELMLDPFVYGRGSFSAGGQPLGFAPDRANSVPPDIALAYAGLLKAPPQQTFDQRWTAWGAGFGGSGTANGDPIVGSNNVTTSTYGYAAGMDYHYSPDTVLGFSLAGGGTNWNLAQGARHRPERCVPGRRLWGDARRPGLPRRRARLRQQLVHHQPHGAWAISSPRNFQGQSYAARLEGGYRFVVPVYRSAVGVTPYAALQVQDFQTPAYSETDLTGGGFGLSYTAMSATDTGARLGARFDDLTALGAMPLILRARLAWAHDWVSNPALNASFESLPGTSFTVNRRADPARLGAHLRGRAIVHHAELVVPRQIRRRIRRRLADLRRLAERCAIRGESGERRPRMTPSPADRERVSLHSLAMPAVAPVATAISVVPAVAVGGMRAVAVSEARAVAAPITPVRVVRPRIDRVSRRVIGNGRRRVIRDRRRLWRKGVSLSRWRVICRRLRLRHRDVGGVGRLNCGGAERDCGRGHRQSHHGLHLFLLQTGV